MEIKFTAYGIDTLQRGFAQAPEVATRELLSATHEALMLLESDVKGAWPKHTGVSRASIHSDAFSTATGVLGLVGSAAPVVAFVELGTRPHTPPLEPLLQWVADVLGKTGREGQAAARGIQRKIAREGTTGKILFRQALGRHQAAIQRMYEAAARRIAAHLTDGAAGGLA